MGFDTIDYLKPKPANHPGIVRRVGFRRARSTIGVSLKNLFILDEMIAFHGLLVNRKPITFLIPAYDR
jgi:hypothetical protein